MITSSAQIIATPFGGVPPVFGGLGGVYFSGTALSTPTGVTVTPSQAAHATYSYAVSANFQNLNTVASVSATITTGPAALSGVNYNTISWNAVPGATSYDVWRTDSGNHNLVGTTTALSLKDTGVGASVFPLFIKAPTVSTSGYFGFGTGIYVGTPFDSLNPIMQFDAYDLNAAINARSDLDVLNQTSAGNFLAQATNKSAVALSALALGVGTQAATGVGASAAGYPDNIQTIVTVAGITTNGSNWGAGTITNLVGLQCFTSANLGGGTVTNNVGIWINTPGSFGTTNYGILIDSITGGTPWAIYTAGSTPSLFGGSVTTGAHIITAATPTTTTGQLGLGTTTGIGNGVAGNVQAPAKSTGSGPTTPGTIVQWLEIDLAGSKYWIPLAQ